MKTESKKDDTYNDWVERMAAGRESKPLNADRETLVGLEPPQSYSPIEFLRLDRKHYIGEVGKRGDEHIFHFYPKAPFNDITELPDGSSVHSSESAVFEERLGDVFLDVFKNPNQVQAVWTGKLNTGGSNSLTIDSWAIKVTGFVNTVWGDDQALSVFDKLDKALGQ